MRNWQSEEDLNPTFFEEVVPIVGSYMYMKRVNPIASERNSLKRRYEENIDRLSIIQGLEVGLLVGIGLTYL